MERREIGVVNKQIRHIVSCLDPLKGFRKIDDCVEYWNEETEGFWIDLAKEATDLEEYVREIWKLGMKKHIRLQRSLC